MMTLNNNRSVWPGLALLSVLTASLWQTAARAHEVPHEAPHTMESSTQTTAGADAERSAAGAESAITELVGAFRRTGDDDYLERAWSLLEAALDSEADNPQLLVEAAMVAQARHRFDTALALLDRALSLARNNDQAWLLAASIHLVRGDVEAADRACGALSHVPLLLAITCRARVAIAGGEHEKPLRQMTALLESAAANTLKPQWLAWSLSVAGDAAAPIDSSRAVAFYEHSLRAAESTQVRAALVDVLLRANRLEDAERVLDAGAGALPLDIRRMIVARRVGRESEARAIAAADHEFQHWIADEDWLHAREMARFYLDVVERPALARRLAGINLAMQREPEDLLLASRTNEL